MEDGDEDEVPEGVDGEDDDEEDGGGRIEGESEGVEYLRLKEENVGGRIFEVLERYVGGRKMGLERGCWRDSLASGLRIREDVDALMVIYNIGIPISKLVMVVISIKEIGRAHV